MGNISKNLNSVEFVSAKSVKTQASGLFNLDNDFTHESEDVTIQLVMGKRADWPMALVIFSDARKLVSVASLPKELLITKGDKVTLAIKEARVSFTKGNIVVE
jgi:hypothetical protein